MFQGNDLVEEQNAKPLTFNPAELTHVFVTHAHLDHAGRLPLLTKNGYQGFIYATAPTIDLIELILRDALNVMRHDHEAKGRVILYEEEDIAQVMSQCKKVEYGAPLTVANDATAVFHDAGHIFGSAFVELNVEGKKIIFTGDVGNRDVPILRDTESLPRGADLIVSESTYGDRLHDPGAGRGPMIKDALTPALARGGVVMIPSFSLERTQELIYELNHLVETDKSFPRVPIFVDSPLAIAAMQVYRNYPQYYDAPTHRAFADGDDVFMFPGLKLTATREESMKINSTPGPKVIIAGAGMMTGGRILHHAVRYLSDPRNTIIFIGYQSPGTLGRQILEGQSPVRVMNEEVPVKCHIKMIGALSAHADQKKLIEWLATAAPKQICLNHGDPQSALALQKLLADKGLAVRVAAREERVEI